MTQAIHVANRDVKEKELRFYRQGSSRENNRGNLNRAETSPVQHGKLERQLLDRADMVAKSLRRIEGVVRVKIGLVRSEDIPKKDVKHKTCKEGVHIVKIQEGRKSVCVTMYHNDRFKPYWVEEIIANGDFDELY